MARHPGDILRRRLAGSLLIALLAGLAAYGAGWGWARLATPGHLRTGGPVVHNDPTVPGRWLMALDDGLLVVVGRPYFKYDHVSLAPTFPIWAANLGAKPVTFGYENFRVRVGGKVRPVDDGEPALSSGPLAPLEVRRGAVTYYGPAVDALLLDFGGRQVVLEPEAAYPEISAVAPWLTARWGALPQPGRRAER